MLNILKVNKCFLRTSKNVLKLVSVILERTLESLPQNLNRGPKVHFKRKSLPSFNEGFIGSRYYPPSRIEITEERIKNFLSEKPLQTTEEWENMKIELMTDLEVLSEVNFSSIMMNCLLSLNKVSEGHSFMKYLAESKMEPNFLTYLKYMALCGKNVDQCGEEVILLTFKKVKAFIDAAPVLDLKRAELLVQGLCSTKQWQLSFDYLKKIPKSLMLTMAIKNCLAAAAIRNGNETLAWEILTKWFQKDEVPKNHVLKELVLHVLKLQQVDIKSAEIFICKLFKYVQQKGVIVDQEVVKLIEIYFKCFSSRWLISYSKVSRGGVCNSCKKSLKIIDLSPEDFIYLRNSFLERSIKKTDLFINTTEREFNQYIAVINSQKPFQMVLDGLNVAHTIETRKTPFSLALHLLKVVEKLSEHSDRLLVLGRHHMATWPAPIMNQISKRASLFLTSNMSQDDPFLVYAALASGPSSYIVSLDLMRDHMARLDDPKLIRLFQRWQQTHQIFFSVDDKNNLKFTEPLRHSINIQGSMMEGWHIPFDDKIILEPYEELNNWLCVQRI